MTLDLAPFREFAAQVTVPTKEFGNIKLGKFFGTQDYLGQEIQRGWAEGVRAFVILKGGRQVGGSTWLDLFALYWLQTHPGMIGQMVSDDLGNMQFRRLLLRQMLGSLPPPYRYPVNADNLGFLQWAPPNGSTLLFDWAGVRDNNNLGRSKGVNFLYADEVGSWVDHKAVGALKASLAEQHPDRFYAWISTARGYNVFQAMWLEAQEATATRAIFLPWWRHAMLRIEEGDPRWKQYAQRMTADEKLLTREVKRRYGVDLEPEQIVWYRWKRAEEFLGDETLMSQEYGSLPEECFQAFGDKFVDPKVIRQLQIELKDAPTPSGYTYEPGKTFDATKALPCAPSKAPLLVWEEPEYGAAYIIAGHAWGSSSPQAQHWLAQVWRVWPDALTQVAEYASETGTTYGLAWLLLYLGVAYGRTNAPHMINCLGGPGHVVTKEMQLMRDKGYGLSREARRAGLQDELSFLHFFWVRADKLGWQRAPIDMEVHGHWRPYVLHPLADCVVRGNMTIRSPALIASLAGLRRGEAGDADEIGGGGGASDAHAMCAALAVRMWHDVAMEIGEYVPPKVVDKDQPTSVGQALIASFMGELLTRGRTSPR